MMAVALLDWATVTVPLELQEESPFSKNNLNVYKT